MIYCFDLDNTLCSTKGRDYENAIPIHHRIDKVNKLYDDGHYILIYTARGMGHFKGDTTTIESTYRLITEEFLGTWGVKYHKLQFGKPSYDYIIDDKNICLDEFDSNDRIVGIVAGSFDLIHPGYINMFEQAKNHCSYLIVALHKDPSIERSDKIPPVLCVEERASILKSIRYVDEVIFYETESQLVNILDDKNPKIRFLGDDYIGRPYTKGNSDIEIIFLDRSHGWSTTRLKNLVHEQLKDK